MSIRQGTSENISTAKEIVPHASVLCHGPPRTLGNQIFSAEF